MSVRNASGNDSSQQSAQFGRKAKLCYTKELYLYIYIYIYIYIFVFSAMYCKYANGNVISVSVM